MVNQSCNQHPCILLQSCSKHPYMLHHEEEEEEEEELQNSAVQGLALR